MRTTLFLILAAAPCVFAQGQSNDAPRTLAEPEVFFYQTAPGADATVPVNALKKPAPVLGEPYSATIATESIQTLADGNRIVAKTTGAVARDALGRTRQQMELPIIGNLAAADIPQIVFIQDPVAKVSYSLNLTNKTAHEMPVLPPIQAGLDGISPSAPEAGPGTITIMRGAVATDKPLPPPSRAVVIAQKGKLSVDQGQSITTDLGSQIIEGVVANGTRTTLTIPAGQIGNDSPISVVTEEWTSPDLKAIVYSKRSDPRMGERTFQLTNLQRGEPDPSLFTVPPDFTMIEGPQPVVYGPR